MSEVNPQPTEHKPRARKRRVTVTQEMVDGIVNFINIPITVLATPYALDPTECKALSNALLDAAQTSDVISTIIGNLTTVGGMSELAIVGGALGAKRFVIYQTLKHPDNPDTRLNVLRGASEAIVTSVASRATPIISRKHRSRQDKSSPTDIETTAVRDSVDNEIGQSELGELAKGKQRRTYRRRGARGALDSETPLRGSIQPNNGTLPNDLEAGGLDTIH